MTGRQQLSVVAVILTLAAVGTISVRHFWGNELSPLGVGTQAPNFHAQTLDTPARSKTLADYTGQVVLLNIWATWCQPCRAEMPSLEQLYNSYKAKGFTVVAISIDDVGMESGIAAFARQLGLTFEILHDPNDTIQQTYQTTGVPESVVIGRDGVIRKKVAGAIDWNSAGNRALIAHLLAE